MQAYDEVVEKFRRLADEAPEVGEVNRVSSRPTAMVDLLYRSSIPPQSYERLRRADTFGQAIA